MAESKKKWGSEIMGKIRERLGQLGDKAFGTPQERAESRERERTTRKKEREAYDTAYEKERIRQAGKRGRAKARQPSGLSSIANIMGDVGKAFDPFSKPKPKPRKRSSTVTVRVVTGKGSTKKRSAPRRKREWWEDF